MDARPAPRTLCRRRGSPGDRALPRASGLPTSTPSLSERGPFGRLRRRWRASLLDLSRGRIADGGRNDIPFHALQLAGLEKHRDAATFGLAAIGALANENVVPARQWRRDRKSPHRGVFR